MNDLTKQAKQFTEKQGLNALVSGKMTVDTPETETETAGTPETKKAGSGASRYFGGARRTEILDPQSDGGAGSEATAGEPEIKNDGDNLKNIKSGLIADIDDVFLKEPFNTCKKCGSKDVKTLNAILSEGASYCNDCFEHRNDDKPETAPLATAGTTAGEPEKPAETPSTPAGETAGEGAKQ